MSVADFKADTKLRLVPELQMVLRGDRLVLKTGTSILQLSAEMLTAIDLFRKPKSLREAMQALRAKTKLDWMAASATILSIHQSGILVSEAAPVATWAKGFSLPSVHIRMLDDSVRTGGYIEAIQKVVRPDDVVVDVGTGTGVLAVAAAKAGARKVYAIESTGIADAAELMFKDNGLDDRIELVRGLSTDVQLPEKADVLVSEIIGNDPFDENILLYVRDAVLRFLKPNGSILPRRLRVFLTPCRTGDEFRSEHLFSTKSANWWHQLYGYRFDSLQEVKPADALQIHVVHERVREFEPVGPAVCMLDVDLLHAPNTVAAQVGLRSYERARVDSAVLHFEVGLLEDLSFNNDPWDDRSANHWGVPVWLLPEPLELTLQHELPLDYSFSAARATMVPGKPRERTE